MLELRKKHINMSKKNKDIIYKENIINEIDNFLLKHQATLDKNGKKWLIEFEFKQSTKIYNRIDFIEICNCLNNWGEVLMIKKDGASNLMLGNML